MQTPLWTSRGRPGVGERTGGLATLNGAESARLVAARLPGLAAAPVFSFFGHLVNGGRRLQCRRGRGRRSSAFGGFPAWEEGVRAGSRGAVGSRAASAGREEDGEPPPAGLGRVRAPAASVSPRISGRAGERSDSLRETSRCHSPPLREPDWARWPRDEEGPGTPVPRSPPPASGADSARFVRGKAGAQILDSGGRGMGLCVRVGR